MLLGLLFLVALVSGAGSNMPTAQGEACGAAGSCRQAGWPIPWHCFHPLTHMVQNDGEQGLLSLPLFIYVFFFVGGGKKNQVAF